MSSLRKLTPQTDDEFERLAHAYLYELSPALDDMETLVLSLTDQTQPQASVLATLQSMARTLHSIKGSSGSFGFDLISLICHNCEDRILSIRIDDANRDGQVDGLLRYLDRLRSSVAAYLGKNQVAIDRIRSQFTKASAGRTTAMTSAQPAKRRKVLVIEKINSFLNLMNKTLREHDGEIEIAVARNGHEGLGRLLVENFDCVMMSNLAELLSGVQLMRILGETANPNRKTPFILLTSSEPALPQTEAKALLVQKSAQLHKELPSALTLLLGPPAKVAAPVNAPFPYQNILLIDDSIFIHRLAEMALRKTTDATFTSAMSGAEALEKMDNGFKPDLILLDCQMPEMDGQAVAEELKKRFPLIPFVFFTGTLEDHEALMAIGAKAVFKKPFPPSDLAKWIRALAE